MSTELPGWSTPFTPEQLRQLDRLAPMEEITREWAWGGSTGKGVKVAILDSGVEASHPAVAGVAGYVSVSHGAQGIELDESPHEDVFGHGTACAGIIRSLAPDCELYSVRVLDAFLSARGEVFAAGLRWAIEHGMDVCNLSLTTPKKAFFGVLHELADEAYFRNVALITSASNAAVRSFPAMYASVLAVASHDTPDPEVFYYNPAPPVEFGAYGVNVSVAWKGGKTLTSTGNSFATPHISGLVARILAKHPGLTNFQLKVILRALATNVAEDRGGAPSGN